MSLKIYIVFFSFSIGQNLITELSLNTEDVVKLCAQLGKETSLSEYMAISATSQKFVEDWRK